MIRPTLDGAATHAGRLVDGWWTRVVSGEGVVMPDGVVDLMWSPGIEPWLAGPDTRPRPVDRTPGTRVVGVRLRLGVAEQLLQDSVGHAADQLVATSDLSTASSFARITDALAATDDAAIAADLLAAAVAAAVPSGWQPDPLVAHAVRRFEQHGSFSEASVGERQFRRRFTNAVGYGPALYRQVARLDRFASLAEQWPARTNAELAALAGYFDEAHLSRDCRKLAAQTPRQFRDR